MIEVEKITAFNKDQVRHIAMVQHLVLDFCVGIIQSTVGHDESKFSDDEYLAFVESRESLNTSTTGTDEEYQKRLKGDSIQKHITENPHHPEYWDKRGEPMPLGQVVVMFFDWYSRSLQRRTGMDGFWKFNLDKLKNQPHAIPIVEALKKEICEQ